MWMQTNPFGREVVVVEEEPGALGNVAVVEDLANDADGFFDVSQTEIDVGVSQAAANADDAARVRC